MPPFEASKKSSSGFKVYIYIYMYILCMYIDIYIYMHIHTCTYVYVYIYTYIYIYTHLCRALTFFAWFFGNDNGEERRTRIGHGQKHEKTSSLSPQL